MSVYILEWSQEAMKRFRAESNRWGSSYKLVVVADSFQEARAIAQQNTDEVNDCNNQLAKNFWLNKKLTKITKITSKGGSRVISRTMFNGCGLLKLPNTTVKKEEG